MRNADQMNPALREHIDRVNGVRPTLDLQANEQQFTPVALDAHDPLPSDLAVRVSKALAEVYDRHFSLRNSEDYHLWNPQAKRQEMRLARQRCIQEWNDEQMNAQAK